MRLKILHRVYWTIRKLGNWRLRRGTGNAVYMCVRRVAEDRLLNRGLPDYCDDEEANPATFEALRQWEFSLRAPSYHPRLVSIVAVMRKANR